jgi:site-specific DNA-methyltransferase (adenine-specific)
VLCLCATGPKLDLAIDLIRAWDFHYRGILFNWVKTAKDGHIIEGQGVRPSFTKPTTELVLVGSTQPEGRTLPIFDEGMAQVVFAPRSEHSSKPDEVRVRIQELWGDVPRLELFARAKYPGWDSWGLEVDSPMPSALAESPRLRERLLEYEENQRLRDVVVSLEDLPQE